MDIFKKEISIYDNLTDTQGRVGTIGEFLAMGEAYKNLIESYRGLELNLLRRLVKRDDLPAATISGVFSERRDNCLIQHSGIVCMDFDFEDNLNFKYFDSLKSYISKFDNVAYCSHSVSGKGYFVLIPIKYPDKHRQHIEAIRRDFLKLGLIADLHCVNVSRARTLSYDPHPFINENAVEYTAVWKQPAPTITPHYYTDGDLGKVQQYCDTISRRHIDVTNGYNNWFRLCAAFASLGEQGRQFFHQVSREYASYKYAECDRKFTQIMRSVHRISIATFFQICKEYGIEL
jgi:hypothetical protein